MKAEQDARATEEAARVAKETAERNARQALEEMENARMEALMTYDLEPIKVIFNTYLWLPAGSPSPSPPPLVTLSNF